MNKINKNKENITNIKAKGYKQNKTNKKTKPLMKKQIKFH